MLIQIITKARKPANLMLTAVTLRFFPKLSQLIVLFYTPSVCIASARPSHADGSFCSAEMV